MNPLAQTFVLLSLLAGTLADAAQPARPVPASQLCVDRIVLKTGRTIRGAVLRQERNGSLSMAVAREWLQQHNPDLLARLTKGESATERQAREQLRDRLKKELVGAAESSRLAFFLSKELERVERELARTERSESPQFVRLDLQREEMTTVARAVPERQRVALWAWERRLAGAESRDANDLARELKTRGVDVNQPAPDLSDRLPVHLQGDREWAARLALVTYAMGEPLDFQGTGDVLVRTSGARGAAEMGPLIVKMLRSQIDALTKELTSEGRTAPVNPEAANDWVKPAIQEAERLDALEFRATRVDLQLERRQVVVQTAFVVRFDERDWETIWSAQHSEQVRPRAEAEARIASDPQVKASLDLMKNLGIGGEEQIQQAIRFGAATMAAQQGADNRFYEFRDRLLKRLDGPPLWWPAP